MAEAVVATVLLLVGAVFVVSVLGWFWVGGRYRSPDEGLGPAERAWVAREAGDLLAELAPRAILLVEKERAVEAALREGDPEGGAAARRRLERADLCDFWGRFVRASVLVDEDPAVAVRELPALGSLLEESLRACDEVLGMLGALPGTAERVERGGDRGGE